MKQLLNRLWVYFPKKRKVQYTFLLIFIIFSSFLEVLSISSILPFLKALTEPAVIKDYSVFNYFILYFELSEKSYVILIAIIFILLSIIANLARIALLYSTTKITFNTGADIALDIYKKTLYQPYLVHISRNSNEVVSGIMLKSNTIASAVILPLVLLINSTIIFVVIVIFLIQLEPVLLGSFFFLFGSLYSMFSYFSKKKISIISNTLSTEQTLLLKSLTEGLGGIRDVIIENSQEFYCKIFRESDRKLRDALISRSIISGTPRFLIELVAIILLSLISLYIALFTQGIVFYLPVLGSLALGIQRLLPNMQLSYSSLTTLRSSKTVFKDIMNLLEQSVPVYYEKNYKFDPLEFKDKIELKNVSFKYNPTQNTIINDLNLVIKKGEKIGFIGTTGTGKSTLLDILMGLLTPTSGNLIIDGEIINGTRINSWQRLIAHVPQSIYLSDSSIYENIAFGIEYENIDKERVIDAAKQAQVANYIEKLPQEYDTLIGERGVKLSGGQRQRIGIARALYKKAAVLVLDEATSALDNETEKSVMKSINSLDKNLTILIIAHRLSTIENCDRIIEINNGSILH